MNIGQIVDKIPIQKLHKESDKLVDSKTLLGVEVEVENCLSVYDASEKYSGYWDIKDDNSLRNHGKEFVFSDPLYGADALVAIEWLLQQAPKHKWKISTLTGIHVHMDIRDMEVSEFRTFCTAYALTEPLIYNWVGNNRFENIFCLPWYMADVDMESIAKVAKEASKERAKYYLSSLSRYSGLNLNSTVKFGTAEFRMLKTTFDFERILDWLNIILSLKKIAMSGIYTPESLCKFAKTHTPYGLALKIFGPILTNKMWYREYQVECLGVGLVTADWFLYNTKDLEIKNKGAGAAFEWSRIRNLKASDEGEHSGFLKWKSRNFPNESPNKKKTLTKGFVLDEFLQANNDVWVQMPVDPEENG